MKKIFNAAFAAIFASMALVACDEDDPSLKYEKQVFPVGEVTWSSSVNASDRAVITDLINNMVKVEQCQFFMGAQGLTYKRVNFFSNFTYRDTIRDKELAHLNDSYRKDTFCLVYKNAGLWVGPVIECSMPDYYIGRYEITQSQWKAVMGDVQPSGNYCKYIDVPRDSAWYACQGKGDNVAAYNISYTDAQLFCKTLSEKTSLEFRLPTEAEWECAARGGRYSRGYKYAGSDNFMDAGWVYENAANKNRSDSLRYGIRPVGEKQPNEIGLYDMTGNVSEWVANSYYRYCYKDSINPQGLYGGDTLILRGGSWVMKNYTDFSVANRKKFIQSSYSRDDVHKSGSFYDAIANCGFRIAVTSK